MYFFVCFLQRNFHSLLCCMMYGILPYSVRLQQENEPQKARFTAKNCLPFTNAAFSLCPGSV